MDIFKIIDKYYQNNEKAKQVLLIHSRLVAEKALKIASNLNDKTDKDLLFEGSMLHDIGMIYTHAPDIGCNGNHPYICHGILGKKMLEEEGLPKHALICERHTGTGITREEIMEKKLPLPLKDMIPVTLEEQIICYADKFFSKNPKGLEKEKSPEKIEKMLSGYGGNHLDIFRQWHLRFNV
ncbi:MAG: HD domain-containing protein [Desulfobacteraceae bacterium]|nr:HD domain-containing protein [Desulfobacteraceae bacterium]MCB9494727.1 HD domain-containing protein [Desulfobacteraceae bacterium]